MWSLIATSRDWDELLWAWQGWREVRDKKIFNCFFFLISNMLLNGRNSICIFIFPHAELRHPITRKMTFLRHQWIYHSKYDCSIHFLLSKINFYILELQSLMATSRDWDELMWAWKGWRDVRGKLFKDKYEEHVELLNRAATLQGIVSAKKNYTANY